MSRLAGQGAFQKQMSSVDQALYETRAWLVKQFQKKQKTDAFKVIHVPAAAPVCSHREMGHFSREKEREKSDDIWYYVEESTVTTKNKLAIQMSFNDAPGQQQTWENQKVSILAHPKNKYKYVLLC